MATTAVICKVIVCNPYDSRMGGRSYAMWTEGSDYCVVCEDGAEIWLQTRHGWTSSCKEIEKPKEVFCEQEMPWADVSSSVKREVYRILFPAGNEEEENIFALGEEEGNRLNEENAWLKDHVINGEISWTKRLLSRIGRWDSIQYVRSVSHWVGTGYKSYIYRVTVGDKTYEVKFRVTGPDSYSFCCEEIDLAAEEAKRKEYGRKVSALAKKAGVPWNIASLLEDKDAKGNLEALKAAKAVHERELSEDIVHELYCGIARRNDAICGLLEEAALAFAFDGQVRSRRLADYLAGR